MCIIALFLLSFPGVNGELLNVFNRTSLIFLFQSPGDCRSFATSVVSGLRCRQMVQWRYQIKQEKDNEGVDGSGVSCECGGADSGY